MANYKDVFRKTWEMYGKDMNFFRKKERANNFSNNVKKKSIENATKMYRYMYEFCQLSTFHGFKHLAARGRHWIEYAFWTAIILTAMGMALYVSKISWDRYHHYPTVIVMEKNNHDWEITFPTATICPEDKLSTFMLTIMAKTKYESVVTNSSAFIEFFTKLAGNSYENLGDLPDYTEVDPKNFSQIIIEAKSLFAYEISSTLTNESETLQEVFTDFGVCYTYNSKVAPYFNPRIIIGEAPEVNHGNDPINITVNDEDAFASVSINGDYRISISGPFEIPSESVSFQSNNHMNYKEIDVACMAIVTSPEVLQLSVEQRHCRTRSDRTLKISKIYSYNMCRTECRMNLAYKLCGCIPYNFVERGSKVDQETLPICDVKGMKCLGKYGTRLRDLRDPVTKKKEECSCLSLCTDFNFRVLYAQDYKWGEKKVKWQVATFPKARFRRTIIFGFSDMIVGIGATASLFLGCSVLSFVELGYFFTLRLFFIIYSKSCGKHRRKKNDRKAKKLRVAELFN